MLERCSAAFHRMRGYASQLMSQVTLVPPPRQVPSGVAQALAPRRGVRVRPWMSLRVGSLGLVLAAGDEALLLVGEGIARGQS